MKILAFVDIHGNKSALSKLISKAKNEKPDIIISAGDISVFGQKLELLIKPLDELGIPVLFVHGNHETPKSMLDVCSKFHNTHFIHESSFSFDNFVFVGYGGSGFSIVDEEFAGAAKKLRSHLIKGKQLILVTHAPPHNTKLDDLDGEHFGNKSISEFIHETKPLLVICGHFHENAGLKDEVKGVVMINPGPAGAIIEI
ncbi:MAG: metallophosphoesterase [bacterium]